MGKKVFYLRFKINIMKNDKGSKWKVGLFVILSLGLFMGGLFFIGNQKNLFSSVFRMQSIFYNVAGLSVGSNVRFGGITVGTVESIQMMNDTTVKVVMAIQRNVKQFINKNATASIGSDGLMGEKLLVISPGTWSRQNVGEDGMVASHAPVEMDEILGSLKISADHAAVITDELSKMAYRINHGNGALSKLIGDTIFASNITKTMSNLKNSSLNLNENMEAAKHNFLFRGYFKKKKKEAQKVELEKEKKEQSDKQ
jgi:phospholipid/cholesterol/gamma-HCH transport system substrate-binding protein